MSEKIFPLDTRNSTTIYCKCCGNPTLHHIGIRAFKRDEEDSEQGLVLSFDCEEGDLFMHHGSMDSCPSRRRDGIVVICNCELCSALTDICIYQHKGTTYFEVVQEP